MIQKRLTIRNKVFRFTAVLLCLFILTGCGAKDQEKTEISSTTESKPVTTEEEKGTANLVQAAVNDTVTYKKDDEYAPWQDQNPVYIRLNGSAANIQGAGAAFKDSAVTITAPGVYVISGKMDDGQLIVKSEKKGTVRLVLNGVEIQCEDNAALYIKQADKTVISLEAGTENVISDGEKYADSRKDAPNAALFSEDDLTINGSGSLKVYGNYNNGINVKDDLKITGGKIYIKAVDDGMIGRDLTAVREGLVTIEAGGDAMKATNDEKADKGFILTEGGTFYLTAGHDGIQAETSIVIKAGDFTITTGGGSINSRSVPDDRFNPWSREANRNGTTTDGTEAETSESAKGIKSASIIQITGGSLNIDASDDAIHSNDSIQITNGSIHAASGDDGVHADSSIIIEGGEITIVKSYEGIESSSISITGGTIHVTARDDGLNVAGRNDGSSLGGRPGQNSFNVSVAAQIKIDGGFLVINADGDGLDSNGSVFMSNGTVLVHGPTSNGNGPLDYDRTFEISGGLLIAAGSSGMAQAPGEASKQASLMMTYEVMQKAGTIVRVEDSSGKEIVTFVPEKQYQSVLISSPSLKKNETYSLFSGGTAQGAQNGGLYSGTQYQGGEQINSFTITNQITWLNKDGVTQGGGGFNRGGGRMPDGGVGGGNEPGRSP